MDNKTLTLGSLFDGSGDRMRETGNKFVREFASCTEGTGMIHLLNKV